MGKRLDLIGQRFGKLTVVARAGQNKRSSVIWETVCDCGNTHFTVTGHLRSGNVKSCGCLVGHNRVKEITGQRFGRLVALYAVKADRGRAWVCQCDCGSFHTVYTKQLIYGVTKSCGCLQKEICGNRVRTHGMSKTKEYDRMTKRRRRDKQKLYDIDWTYEKEKELLSFFPCCVLCGAKSTLTIDHLRPLSLGFGLDVDNAIVLCRSCNSSKKAKDIDDLSLDIRNKLVDASSAFQKHWSKINESFNQPKTA